jgi:deoxyadenosine/deoxycytidine kinase
MAFQNVPKPDLLIYLQRTNTSLLSNIHSRGRDFEQNLKEPYLMKLTERYSFYLNHFWEGRVLRIDADAKDFLHSETDVQWLIDEIEVL